MQVLMPLLVTKGTELLEDRVLTSVQPEYMPEAVISGETTGCDLLFPSLDQTALGHCCNLSQS
jgi:hypothetical protein